MELREALLAWFDVHRRDLPWRRTRDPYAIWISEVMLQQTQVSTVIPYWERFLERFPTLEALAKSALPDVLSSWRGLGYYSRARNLHRAAQEIVQRHAGQLPASEEALRTLPGFGPYTAGAVASIAFGLAAPVVDGNVDRVLSRLFEVEGQVGDRARARSLWAHAEALVAGVRPGDLNQALMELGALVCRPEPTCLLCPVRQACGALLRGRVQDLPPVRLRASRQPLSLTAALWTQRGKILLARRAEGGLFGGLWELPATEATDSPTEAETRLAKVLGVSLSLGARLAQVRRTLTHRNLTLSVFEARGRGTPRPQSPYIEAQWFALEETLELGMSTAMAKGLAAATNAT